MTVDIWFAVVAPPSGDMDIALKSGTMVNMAMAFYKGPCNNLHLINCTSDDNYVLVPAMQYDNLMPGVTSSPHLAGRTGQQLPDQGDRRRPAADPLELPSGGFVPGYQPLLHSIDLCRYQPGRLRMGPHPGKLQRAVHEADRL